ncbi:MAG: hydrogenase maturation protease [Chloroflexi bacterium]|nr:hydrogenase maturation protease [Chloroflexota bacterium]
MKSLVLALGNPLRGDDGVGTAVLSSLAANHQIPETATLLDGGTPGLETALLFQEYDRVIIIDAADMGKSPGHWQHIDLTKAKLLGNPDAFRGTLHDAGLAEAILLADALNILPADLQIFGIQPEEIGWEPGLSDVVANVVAEVETAVWQTINNQLSTNNISFLVKNEI